MKTCFLPRQDLIMVQQESSIKRKNELETNQSMGVGNIDSGISSLQTWNMKGMSQNFWFHIQDVRLMAWDVNWNLQWFHYTVFPTTLPMRTGNRKGEWMPSGPMYVTEQFVSLASHMKMTAITDKSHQGAWQEECGLDVWIHLTTPFEKHFTWSQ